MKKILIAICLLSILSCKKELGVKSPDLVAPHSELKAEDSVKKMKVFLYTDAGASDKEFVYNFGLDYRSNVEAIDIFTDALWYVHHRLQTADTTLAYLYPYTKVTVNIGNVYARPDSALQADPRYILFQDWFQRLVTNWMSKHECSECGNIIVNGGTSQYFTRITCSVN